MSDGFLGRWSKRKLEVKQKKGVEAEPQTQLSPSPQPSPASGRGSETGAARPSEVVAPIPASEVVAPIAASAGVAPSPSQGEGGGEGSSEVPPLTLEDVDALTAESDFSRFAAGNVTPEVKNAAMKKLFADPRYNIMDGLDVYTGDYTKPDPIPNAVLRKLASARFLGLFDEEERREEAANQARDVADNPTAQTVAQSSAAPQAVPEAPDPCDHADPDLRLQQDHAAPGEDPGRGTG
jgi:hypothetical protein